MSLELLHKREIRVEKVNVCIVCCKFVVVMCVSSFSARLKEMLSVAQCHADSFSFFFAKES